MKIQSPAPPRAPGNFPAAIRRALLFACLFFSLETGHASHIVGGDLTYRCLGNGQYEITFQIYADCYNNEIELDTILWIGIYNTTPTLVRALQIPFDFQRDTLPISLDNPCLTAPPRICVNTGIYRSIVTLPFSPGGYTMAYQRCCRNELIRNIIDPKATSAAFVARIPEAALLACNASAVFRNWPPVAICVHTPIDFDHEANDADGDSLAYRLCIPLAGAESPVPQPMPAPPPPYDEVVWAPGYGLQNVLGGVPLAIDPRTGRLTGTPNTIGNFVVGICVDEFRGGKLISSTRRDFQYNVADCGEAVAAFFAPQTVCNGRALKFVNQSTSANTYSWVFNVGGTPLLTSANASPTITYPDTGRYTVMLVAAGASTADFCRDTFIQEIHLTEGHVSAAFSIGFPDCTGGVLRIAATDFSSDTVFGIARLDWQLTVPGGPPQLSSAPNPVFTAQQPGIYNLRLIATAANGCMDTLERKFVAPFPKLDSFPETLQICPGDTIPLYPKANKSLTYDWSPPGGLDDPKLPNPLAFPLQTTTYTVTATSNLSPCTLEKTVLVEVLDPSGIGITATPPKVVLGQSTQLQATLPGAGNFAWQPDPSLSSTTILNPVATPEDTTLYVLTFTTSSGCEARAQILVPVIFPRCVEPFVFFPTAFSPNGDGENDSLRVEGLFLERVNWVVYDRWGEKIFEATRPEDAWDGRFKGREMPAETYGYHLHIVCANGEELKKKGNVTLLR